MIISVNKYPDTHTHVWSLVSNNCPWWDTLGLFSIYN